MNVPGRLVAFAAVLGVAFGGAVLVGAALDPTDEQPRAEHSDGGHAGGDVSASGGATPVSGVSISQDGFTLEADRTHFPVGEPARFSFRITDERGQVLRDEYELESEREMHLIVVRSDTATYQHLHPRKDGDGTWSIQLVLPEPGSYRAYADFMIDGKQRTLTTSLFTPGDFQPNRLARPATNDSAGGFDVELTAPGVKAGRESQLIFAVTRNGQPVESLEPYLGAKGHLVALREGDLAYLHVHPTEEARPNEIPFAATFPTAGRYRLFLQFGTGGEIRTVVYTVEVPR